MEQLSLNRKVEPIRRVRNGAPTNDLVLSAYVDSNAQVFPQVLGTVRETRQYCGGCDVRQGRILAEHS